MKKFLTSLLFLSALCCGLEPASAGGLHPSDGARLWRSPSAATLIAQSLSEPAAAGFQHSRAPVYAGRIDLAALSVKDVVFSDPGKLFAATFIIPGPFVRANASSFTANTAVFDGSNDYISRSSSLGGMADGKTFTASLWIDFAGLDATDQDIFYIHDGKLRIWKNTSNRIAVTAQTTGGTTILNASSSVSKTASSTWFHLYICINLANSSQRKIYFDGTADSSVTWTTYTDNTIDLDTSAGVAYFRVGAGNGGNNKIHATVAEAWFNDSYLDSPSSFSSGGHPIDIGSAGATPLGSAPVFYLSRSGSGNSWATDSSANANTFTVTGTLTTGTPP